MAKPVISQTHRRVLHALTSIIKGLATAPDGAIDRTDLFLKGISDLPIIKGMLGEVDNDDVSGSEFYTYFSGVALLLRSLLEKVESDEIGLAFLNDVKKIHDDLAPERKRDRSETQKSSKSAEKTKLSTKDHDDEVVFLSAKARTPDPTSPSKHTEIMEPAFDYSHLSSPTRATPPTKWYQARQITLWQNIQAQAHYRPLASTGLLPNPDDTRSTVIALHTTFGPSGINHLRNLEWDLSYPKPAPLTDLTGSIPWRSMLTPQRPENIHALWQCCVYFRDRARARATLGLDAYARNLARMELWRLLGHTGNPAFTLGLGPVIERDVTEQLCEGEKAMLLANMFGKGVLVLIGQDAGHALEKVNRHSLEHVVGTIATWNGGMLYARIQDTCNRAESMIGAAAVGVDRRFQSATQDTIERFHSATQETIESLERIT